MDEVLPGLYASAPETLPFGPPYQLRAFLLMRDSGNLLLYRADTLGPEREAIEQLGGISRQYLNHRHEAAPVCDWVAETFAAPLHCHESEEPSVAETCAVAATFSKRHVLDGDFEVIPTPGHTRGATAFLWDSGAHRVLFTGDTIFARGERWIAAVLDGVSDRERYIESLELIRELDFDVIVPGITSDNRPNHAYVERPEAQRQIDAIIERLRRGEDN